MSTSKDSFRVATYNAALNRESQGALRPIDVEQVRTFGDFLWQDMPCVRLPDNPDTPESGDYYSQAALDVLPLSSKSHWDIPVQVNGETVHLLASHPTPPTLDGEKDRNGLRNADDIRFWSDYVTPGQGSYIVDDQGQQGGLIQHDADVFWPTPGTLGSDSVEASDHRLVG